MIVIRYQSNTVLQATPAYMDVRDSGGMHHHILFRECANSWIEYVKSSADFNIDPNAQIESPCVALTHGIPDNLYIELTWKISVRLSFQHSWLLWRPLVAFLSIQQLIHQLGWRTYDMS